MKMQKKSGSKPRVKEGLLALQEPLHFESHPSTRVVAAAGERSRALFREYAQSGPSSVEIQVSG